MNCLICVYKCKCVCGFVWAFLNYWRTILSMKKEEMLGWKTYILSKTLSRKCRDLCRIVKHYWHYWRVVVPKNFKAHLLQFWSEEIAVLTDSCKFLSPCMELYVNSHKKKITITITIKISRLQGAYHQADKPERMWEECLYLPLLEPSTPRTTFTADITCCTAGGDMDVA